MIEKFKALLFIIDWKAWTWIGDRFLLLLWNQFSIERVHIARLLAPMFAVYMFFDLFFRPPHPPLWVSLPLFFVTILFMGFIALYYEAKHRSPKRNQNVIAIMRRLEFPFIAVRLFMLLFLLLFNIDGFVKGELGTYFMTFVWWWFLNFDCALISEEPPKRWKFKIKLPKFEFKLNTPLPQGA